MIPQILILVLISISLLIAANKHGKPKEGKSDFWASLIGNAITFILLYLGGFFNGMF